MEKMLESIRSEVLPRLQSYIAARSEAEEQIKRLQVALEGYQAKAKAMEAEINALVIKAGELLTAGKDITATEKKSREMKEALAECRDWVTRIEKELLTAANEKLATAEQSLAGAYTTAVNEERDKVERVMNDHITAAMEAFDNFIEAERSLCNELNIKFVKSYGPRLHRFVVDDGRFSRLVDNTLGFVRR